MQLDGRSKQVALQQDFTETPQHYRTKESEVEDNQIEDYSQMQNTNLWRPIEYT